MLKNNFQEFYKDKTEVEHSGGVIFQISTGIPMPAPIEVESKEVIEEVDLL